MRLSRIAQRQAATDWEDEFAIAYVIRKLTYLGGVRLCVHACDLRCRIQRLRALGQNRGVSKRAAWLYSYDQLRRDVTAHGIGYHVDKGQFRNRILIINRDNACS